jgi:hypothetical protein
LEHDQRDRRDPADADADDTVAQTGTGPTDPADPTDSPSPAEVESWPSEPAAGTAWQQPAPTDEPAWPTEPPAAGSAGPDDWPTAAPSRDDEPATAAPWTDEPPAQSAASDEPAPPGGWGSTATPEPAAPPPSEVEAYPGSGTDSRDEALAGAAAAAGGSAVGAAHSVPDTEGAVGESTQCPRCGTENRPGLAFCRSCGQRLVAAGVASTVERPGVPEGTMACPRCGTHNRSGVAFCQNCGANLRGTAAGYVPPAVASETATAPDTVERRGAVLGPVVLLIGLVGVVTGYLLPFLYGTGSLYERAMGSGGYGISFWNGYPEVGAQLADQAYFGLAAPIPLLGLLLLALAVAGFVRAAPGPLQVIGLVIAMLWSVGLIILFLVVELAGNWGGDLVGMLRDLTPAGIIFFLASLIVLIGTLTRFARS